ncbi:MAG TPA: glycosyltransferase family 2 protein [Xanthomonadaceae bacterium]|nr:glycosyltransferase family 2 protein [Xanthomonadaceae bacterium]
MPQKPTLAIVVPAFNEAQGLPELHRRLSEAVAGLDLAVSMLFVDDGSRDDTFAVIESLHLADPRVGGLRLSRNFGKELALTAGLDHVDADAVVVIDADLQDPPELIPDMVARWRDGVDVVYGQRVAREGEGWFKRASAAAFYRIIGRLSHTPIPRDTGDFRLMSRRAHQALGRLRERHRFMKGLFAWVGFRQEALAYRRQPRHQGHSKWGWWRLWNLAVEGITSFSGAPLRMATPLGLAAALGAFSYGAIIIAKTLIWGDPVPGYPSLMVVIRFLGGIQLMALGVMGEYLGRLYEEVKQRPLYLVECHLAPGTEAVAADAQRYDGDAHSTQVPDHADSQPAARRKGA